MMPEKAGGRAQAIVSIESFSPLRPQRIAAMAMQSGVMNTRNIAFQRISVLTLNFTVAKAKPAAKTATPGIGVGNQVKGRIDRRRKLDS